MPWILNFKNGILTLFKLKFQNDVEDAKVDIQAIRWQALKNHIHCSEMLNAIQERKRCNRLVIIPWRNTIPFQELIGDHFRVEVKRNGDHFGVGIISRSIWGSFQGWRSFRGQDHFGGCTAPLKTPASKSNSMNSHQKTQNTSKVSLLYLLYRKISKNDDI